MKNKMMSIAEAASTIESGRILLIAGSETALRHLPKGRWIGGTSVYFLTAEGGRCDEENVFVTVFDSATDCRIRHYGTDTLPGLAADRFGHGFSAILIPSFSKAHAQFAMEGAGYDSVFEQPLMGWITGTHLDEIGRTSPKVFDGTSGAAYDEGAILLHVELPATVRTELDIINLFEQDREADTIVFAADGFSAETAKVNGREVDFADYVSANALDTRLPLVADYAGAMINVSFQTVDRDTGRVQFYAPVVAGVEYRLAKSTGDYATAFAERISGEPGEQLSCNCILNYLYGDMEGKRTGGYTGPVTFGEIAYILLNQTLVHLDFERAEAAEVA
ncbi:hypothetical protein [Poseidonocella sp. HB161398]|uniref:DUF6976 family protein n=1 Tax=Poseidonocella sp. HB161398 TaxID=2320855 RepID=UPI001108A2DA|nr:hypothetical protein [Poseidonocella sp. HB161398]